MTEERLPPDEIIRIRVKGELRKRLRGLRKTMPAEACAKRSQRIVERLRVHPALIAARRVALFWPIEDKHEVDLRTLDEALRVRGAEVAWPAIDPETRLMTFRFALPPDLVERGFGFCEPPGSAREAGPGDLDVIVVPAIALDPTGHRIGYGAGYYDRALPIFSPPAVAIGVAYDFQLVAEVPFTQHDVRLPYVVTDGREMAT